jgi:hypothetical protein
MKIDNSLYAYDPAASAEKVKMQANIEVLDSSLEMAQKQSEQLIEMIQIQDPMMGQNIDIKI